MSDNSKVDNEFPIFLSYAREDEDFCRKLLTDLKQKGINVWMDLLEIKPGQRWDDEIEKAIRQASTMLVVLSPDSVESEHVLDEVNHGLTLGLVIVPVLYKKCDVPFRLLRLQYVDFTSDVELAFERVVAQLRGGPPPPLPRPNGDCWEIGWWKHTWRKRALTRTLASGIGIGVIGLLTAWLLWNRESIPIPLLDIGLSRTLVDVDNSMSESLVLDPGPTLSDNTPIAAYRWTLDDEVLVETRVAHLELPLGLHQVLLSVVDENDIQHEARVGINVLSASEEDQIVTLLSFSQQAIQLAENDFDAVPLVEGVSSPYGALQAVLKMDPFNLEAGNQLRRIADIYAAEAQHKLAQHDIQKATALITQGLKVDQNHSELISLQRDLEH